MKLIIVLLFVGEAFGYWGKKDSRKSDQKVKNTADVAYLNEVTNAARKVVDGVGAGDVSKAKSIKELESLAGIFVSTVRDIKARKGGEEAMVKLEPLKYELKSIARDMEAKLESTKKDPNLPTLINRAETVVAGMGADDVSKAKALTEIESLADQFVQRVGYMKAKRGEKEVMAKLEPLKVELRGIARDMEAKLESTKEEKEKDFPNLPMLVNRAKTVVASMGADDVSKTKALTEIESLADQFVQRVGHMKAKRGEKEVMARLELLKDELIGISHDMKAKLEKESFKDKLRGIKRDMIVRLEWTGEEKKKDVPNLPTLINRAKTVVADMRADDVSKTKALTEIESLADKFVTRVRDMKANYGEEKVMARLGLLKDELRGIARDMDAKLERRSSSKMN